MIEDMIDKFFKNIVVRKIAVIFLVGFISRIIVNYIYDINVFKEYTNFISLVYYGFIAAFTGYVNLLPNISFNVFNLNLIRDAFKNVWGNSLANKIKLGDFDSREDNFRKDFDKNCLAVKQDSSNKYGGRKQKTFKSAGLRGLYGDPGSPPSRVKDSENVLSKSNRISIYISQLYSEKKYLYSRKSRTERNVGVDNVSMNSDESCVIMMNPDGTGRVINNPNYQGRPDNIMYSKFSRYTSTSIVVIVVVVVVVVKIVFYNI